MLGLLINIIAFLIELVISAWLLKLLAKAFNAKRQTWLYAILTLLLSAVLVFAGWFMWFLAMLFYPALLTIIISLLVGFFVVFPLPYILCLGLSYWRGLGIAIVHIVACTVLAIIMALLLMLVGVAIPAKFYQHEKPEVAKMHALQQQKLQRIEAASNKVCACTGDTACIKQNAPSFRRLLKTMHNHELSDKQQLALELLVTKTQQCENKQVPQQISSTQLKVTEISKQGRVQIQRSELNVTSLPPTKQKIAAAEAKTAAQQTKVKRQTVDAKTKPALTKLPASALMRYVGWPVKLTLQDGSVKQGYIDKVENQQLALRQYLHGGHMTVYVAVKNIKYFELEK